MSDQPNERRDALGDTNEPGLPRAERQQNADAPSPGGSAQGIDATGARGTADGGLAAEDDFGSEGGGLTGARGSDEHDPEKSA